MLFLVADSKYLISHEESATVGDHEDEFYPEDCMLQPGWVPYDQRPLPTTNPDKFTELEEL